MAALCLPSTPQGGTRWNWMRIKVLKVDGLIMPQYERRWFFYTVWLFWLCMVVYGWRQPMAGVWNKTRNPKPGGRDVITKSGLVVICPGTHANLRSFWVGSNVWTLSDLHSYFPCMTLSHHHILSPVTRMYGTKGTQCPSHLTVKWS